MIYIWSFYDAGEYEDMTFTLYDDIGIHIVNCPDRCNLNSFYMYFGIDNDGNFDRNRDVVLFALFIFVFYVTFVSLVIKIERVINITNDSRSG